VDTHVSRLSQRLGFTRETAAEKIERDLMKILPQKEWIDFSHLLIWHGRRRCAARKPECESCELREWCPKVGVKRS
jgi:endonuclease-3